MPREVRHLRNITEMVLAAEFKKTGNKMGETTKNCRHDENGRYKRPKNSIQQNAYFCFDSP